jgi:hypothetical protein
VGLLQQRLPAGVGCLDLLIGGLPGGGHVGCGLRLDGL